MRRLSLSFIVLLFLAANPAIAEDTYEGDYIDLEKGQRAPYSGLLFDDAGLARLIARRDKERDQLILAKDTEYKKLKIALEAEVAKKDTELSINKELSEKILALNKEELKTSQAKLEKASWIAPTLFVSGVMAGAFITISVLKVALSLQ